MGHGGRICLHEYTKDEVQDTRRKANMLGMIVKKMIDFVS